MVGTCTALHLPYAFPREPGFLLNVALRRGAEVHWHARGLWQMAGALLRYLRHSHPQRHAQATEAYSRLIAHATDEHDLLIAAAGAQRLVARDGFRFVFRTAQAFDEAAHLDRSWTLRPRAVHLSTPREWDVAGH